MIKSMTGFASLTHEDERATLGVTIRSVNHRFLDLQLRVPQSLAELEPRVRALLQKRLARGRVELAITVQLRHPAAPSIELNEDFANALAATMERARERGLISGTLTPGDLLRHPQAITVRDRPGFASSRLGIAIAMEAIRMVEEGVASPEDIDKAMVHGYGHPMGPLRLTDVVGCDIRLAIADHLAEALKAPHFQPPQLLRKMVAEGRLGKKSGRGFYDWKE